MFGQVARRIIACVLVAGLVGGVGVSRAQARPVVPGPGSLAGQLVLAEWARPRSSPVLPALALLSSVQTPPAPGPVLAPGAAQEDTDVTGKWWFWAAIGGVVAATVVLFIVASQGGTDEPETRLGNMEIFK